MTVLSGTTGTRPIVATHESPANIALGQKNPGEKIVYQAAPYTNTGNVAQTVTVVAESLRNIASIDTLAFTGTTSNTVTVQAGEGKVLDVAFTIRDVENTDFSFTLTDTWTVA